MSNENENTDVVENEDDTQEEQEETLFDAVSAAIDAETIDPEGADGDPDDTGDEEDGDETDDSGSEGEDAGEGEAESVDSDDEAGSEGTGEEGSDEEGDEAEEAEGAEGQAEEGEVTPDPINDPIPEGIKESTKERIQTLIGRAKEGEEAAAERDDFVNMVTSTGADAEQFSATLGWLSLYNSAKLDDRRKALTIMQQAVVGLAKEIGEPVAGDDVLSQHADLQAEVEEGTLTEARAMEIAQSRNRQAAETQINERTAQVSEQQRRANAAVQQGKQELNALEVALKASDPRYVEKKAILIPALQQMMRTIHPSEWRATFQQAYDRLKLPEKSATPTAPKKIERDDSHEPLRPKQPAGQGKKEPTTMEQAIDAALDSMEG